MRSCKLNKEFFNRLGRFQDNPNGEAEKVPRGVSM